MRLLGPDFKGGNLSLHPRQDLGWSRGLWRMKKGMPDRYRLCFRFASSPVKPIVYVWFNDEDTLRKAGAKSDVDAVFRRMLERGEVQRGEVPGSIGDLLTACEEV